MSNEIPEITVHWLQTSRAHRIVWLLEELELPYTIKPYKRVGGLAPKELKDIHPLGKSPLVTLKFADGTEKVLHESGFMTEYFGEKYGKDKGLYGDGGWDERYWLHYAEGTLMPINVFQYVFDVSLSKTPLVIRPIISMIFDKISTAVVKNNAKDNEIYLEETLKKNGGYLVGGKFRLVDVLVGWTAMLSAQRLGWKKEGEIADWLERLRERDAYKRAKKKNDDLENELKAAKGKI